MTYILIFVLYSTGKVATGNVEFATVAACQGAAAEIRRQLYASHVDAPVVMCAAKGK